MKICGKYITVLDAQVVLTHFISYHIKWIKTSWPYIIQWHFHYTSFASFSVLYILYHISFLLSLHSNDVPDIFISQLWSDPFLFAVIRIHKLWLWGYRSKTIKSPNWFQTIFFKPRRKIKSVPKPQRIDYFFKFRIEKYNSLRKTNCW